VFSAQGSNLMFSHPKGACLDLFTIVKKDDPAAGQRDVRSRAIKELNANILFKRLDLEAYCGLREVQFFGGLAKAELLRNCPEDHETEIFEARHSMIRTLICG
jgi:hypothetical protein